MKKYNTYEQMSQFLTWCPKQRLSPYISATSGLRPPGYPNEVQSHQRKQKNTSFFALWTTSTSMKVSQSLANKRRRALQLHQLIPTPLGRRQIRLGDHLEPEANAGPSFYWTGDNEAPISDTHTEAEDEIYDHILNYMHEHHRLHQNTNELKDLRPATQDWLLRHPFVDNDNMEVHDIKATSSTRTGPSTR